MIDNRAQDEKQYLATVWQKIFFKKALLSVGALLSGQSAWSHSGDQVLKLRIELMDAFQQSEKMTLAIIEQMPEGLFGYKYTPEAMSFAEQFRHCAVFTLGQVSARLKVPNPYQDAKPKVDLSKSETIAEVKKMYLFLHKTVQEIPAEKLLERVDFAEGIPAWRFLYAMENHIIHHRGQAICYLRLKGITPKGYFGW